MLLLNYLRNWYSSWTHLYKHLHFVNEELEDLCLLENVIIQCEHCIEMSAGLESFGSVVVIKRVVESNAQKSMTKLQKLKHNL